MRTMVDPNSKNDRKLQELMKVSLFNDSSSLRGQSQPLTAICTSAWKLRFVVRMAEPSRLHSCLVLTGLGESVKYDKLIKVKTRGQTTLTKHVPTNRKIVNTSRVLKASSHPFPFIIFQYL